MFLLSIKALESKPKSLFSPSCGTPIVFHISPRALKNGPTYLCVCPAKTSAKDGSGNLTPKSLSGNGFKVTVGFIELSVIFYFQEVFIVIYIKISNNTFVNKYFKVSSIAFYFQKLWPKSKHISLFSFY